MNPDEPQSSATSSEAPEKTTMSLRDKKAVLRRITTEADFREVLMDLFEKMSLQPILSHGDLEAGKDIVGHEANVFAEKEWIAFVVKCGAITGGTSGTAGLHTILTQAEEALVHYFDHPNLGAIPMSKVYIVTNDHINDHARAKLGEKLRVGKARAGSVFFLEGARLCELIDEHWPEYWGLQHGRYRTDEMSPAEGEILYVIALAFTLHSRSIKKAASPYVGRDQIMRQCQCDPDAVDGALEFLLGRKYLETRDPDGYALNRKLTTDRILSTAMDVRLVRAIAAAANGSRRITLSRIRQISSRAPLKFSATYVREALRRFLKGGYLDPDASRGPNHFLVNRRMLSEEKAYLDCWVRYDGDAPSRADRSA